MTFAVLGTRLGLKALDALEKELQAQERKTRIGAAIALTKTAKRAERNIRSHMAAVIDRPTRWALNGLYTVPATKTQPTAAVRLKDESAIGNRGNSKGGTPAVNFLQPHIDATRRSRKGYENKLEYLGILQPGEYTVPGNGVRLNRNGNITRNALSKMLADVQVSRGFGDGIPYGLGQGTTTKGKRRYFYNPNLKPRGIWMRIGKGARIRPFLIFVQGAPSYKKRIDFYGIAEKTFARNIDKELDAAIDFLSKPRGSK